ncbi:hypothetical protein EDB87DRAFT_1720799, partial [Lactarius vividus]
CQGALPFHPAPSHSTKGFTIVPCCLHAPLLVRIGTLLSQHHHLGSPATLANASVDQNPRPKHASRSKFSSSTSAWPFRLWRSLWISGCVVRIFQLADGRLGGHNCCARFGKRHVTRRTCKAWTLSVSQPLASGGCPSAGIYTGPFVHLLGPAPGVQRAFSVLSCFLLPSAMASVKRSSSDLWRLSGHICIILCPIGFLLATARTSAP